MTERPKLKQFYKELYEMHCLYGGMTNTPENWQDCMNYANELANRNGASDFVCKVIANILEQLELEQKERK